MNEKYTSKSNIEDIKKQEKYLQYKKLIRNLRIGKIEEIKKVGGNMKKT